MAVALMASSCNFLENMFGADDFSDLPSSKRFKYKVGDEVLFKDDQDKVDTFTVSMITTDYRVSDKRYHYQYQDILLKPQSTTTLENIRIYYENTFFKIFTADNYIFQYLSEIDPVSTTINNHLIKNTYNFNDTIIFHYQYGLLRYKEGNRLLEQIIE